MKDPMGTDLIMVQLKAKNLADDALITFIRELDTNERWAINRENMTAKLGELAAAFGLRLVEDADSEAMILNTLDDENQRKLLVAIAETGGQTVTEAARDMLNQGIRRAANQLMNGSAA